MFCFPFRYIRLRTQKYRLPRLLPVAFEPLVLLGTEYRRREMSDIISHFNHAKGPSRRTMNIKPTVHKFALNWPVQVTEPVLWSTARCFESKEAGLKILSRKRATVVFETRGVVQVFDPVLGGLTKYCEQHKWENLKSCALFSIQSKAGPGLPCAKEVRRMVVNMPVVSCLTEDSVDAEFRKCERKPQSQLVKDIVSLNTGALSRIAFFHPATFTRFDVTVAVTRFLRTKKNTLQYKHKTENKIYSCVEGKVFEPFHEESKTYLSYGTV